MQVEIGVAQTSQASPNPAVNADDGGAPKDFCNSFKHCECTCKCFCSWAWCCLRSTPLVYGICFVLYLIGHALAVGGFSAFSYYVDQLGDSGVTTLYNGAKIVIQVCLSIGFVVVICGLVITLCVTGWMGEELISIQVYGIEKHHEEMKKLETEIKEDQEQIAEDNPMVEEELKSAKAEKLKKQSLMCCIYIAHYTWRCFQDIGVWSMYVLIVMYTILVVIFAIVSFCTALTYGICDMGSTELAASLCPIVYELSVTDGSLCSCSGTISDFSCDGTWTTSQAVQDTCNEIGDITTVVIVMDVGLAVVSCMICCMWGKMIGNMRHMKTLLDVAEDADLQEKLNLIKRDPEITLDLETPEAETQVVPAMGDTMSG